MGRSSAVAFVACLLACARAWAQDPGTPPIELLPVVGGLNQPVFVTSALDGTNRLFIVEQPGMIKVLPPGATLPRQFLDISPKVLAGGERGLLGLAFHPEFRTNGRFFVDYTRQPDGATVIAEYRASTADPNVADTAEKILLTIPQPFPNHNGGMLAFGPDGYLYVGMGDGGSANDPGNRAQDPRVLLGKILRLDINAGGTAPYASPPTNPFAGNGQGRGEIYALGLRNPWRFSFDRTTGQLYAGDVGQNEVEEIDVIRLGANYGWRVLEGTRCTNLGPLPCDTPSFAPPVTEYLHEGGRCSVTGGYVYRGTRGSLPSGTYVFGDYCSGEIFFLNGSDPARLTDTDLTISSFGEDESGELYVASLNNGTVYRIANPTAAASSTLYFPMLSTVPASAAGPDSYTGFALTNLDSDTTQATFTAYDSEGNVVSGSGITNPRTVMLAPAQQLPIIDAQIWGPGWSSATRRGWAKVESDAGRLAGFFVVFDSSLTVFDGADAGAENTRTFILPEIEGEGFTQICVANPGPAEVSATLDLVDAGGAPRSRVVRNIPANGAIESSLQELFPDAAALSTDFIKVSATWGVVAFEYLGIEGRHARGLNGQDATAGASTLYAPQYVSDGSYTSTLSLINLDAGAATATLQLHSDDGTPVGGAVDVPLGAGAKVQVADLPGNAGTGQGYLKIRSNGARLTGSVTFRDTRQDAFATALPLVSAPARNLVFSQVASNDTYFTGIALLNPAEPDANVRIQVSNAQGNVIASGEFQIRGRGRVSRLLTEYFPNLASSQISSGYIKVESDQPLAGFALFGTRRLSALSAIPSQQ